MRWSWWDYYDVDIVIEYLSPKVTYAASFLPFWFIATPSLPQAAIAAFLHIVQFVPRF